MAMRLGKETGNTPKAKDGGVKGVCPWDKKWPPPKGTGDYYVDLNVDNFEYTSPVGSFSANQHGIHDLGGNVWEWCEDKWSPTVSARMLRGGVLVHLDALIPCCRLAAASTARAFDVCSRMVLIGEMASLS